MKSPIELKDNFMVMLLVDIVLIWFPLYSHAKLCVAIIGLSTVHKEKLNPQKTRKVFSKFGTQFFSLHSCASMLTITT